MRGGDPALKQGVRECLADRMAFEQRPGGGEGRGPPQYLEKQARMRALCGACAWCTRGAASWG